MSVIEVSRLDRRPIARVMMGEGQGAEWVVAGNGTRLFYVRSEPNDWIAVVDDDLGETERHNARYAQSIEWLLEKSPNPTSKRRQ